MNDLHLLTSVGEMKERYEKGLSNRGHMINKGQVAGWKEHFSKEYEGKFDEATRNTFGDDSIVEKFI